MYIITTLLTLLSIVVTLRDLPFRKMNNFGMNKPHLLFHLGERKKVASNFGIAYWQNNPDKHVEKHFSDLRIHYENTKNGLYVNMVNHDSDGHIHQEIGDEVYRVKSDVKYQMLEDGWEQHLHMEKLAGGKKDNSAYWMQFMTVENTDHSLVNVFDSTSKTPKFFQITERTKNEAKISIETVGEKTQTITMKSSTPLKVFGFSQNISETYNVRDSMGEIKYLIELDRYNMKKRKNDSDLVKWEDQQLKYIKKDDWTGHKFVVLVFYGEFTEQCDVFMGNRSKQFQGQHFQTVSKRIDQQFFNHQAYSQHSDFLKHILYNLYGGIAFYQGGLYTQNSLIKHEFDSFHSFTPSRLIFPRGFLWDDGFHLSVAVHYNPSLTINVLENWIKKIDLFGWIGREQIRGFEMGSLMPEAKFVYQDSFQMNPPTLILPILTLIEQAKSGQLHESNVEVLNSLLRQNFWKLQKWFRYFLKTQSHNNLIEKESILKTLKYRWRCKDDCQRGNFMGSGLDDYPRIENQQQLSKQHVDLISWFYFFADGLQNIAYYLQLNKPAFYYHKKKIEMRSKIFEECLDSSDFVFKDQTVKARNQFVDRLVTKNGYISLFPFFLGVLDQGVFEEQIRKDFFSQEQRDQLNLLREKMLLQEKQLNMAQVKSKLVEIMMDPEQLMSEDGLRSLSISDPLYGTLDNYWRGAVWMPINYLVLRACKKHYWDDPQVRQLYETLRQKLISTVKQNWKETGYLFQNYHQGKGNRGHPFYGWSSLITQIITQKY